MYAWFRGVVFGVFVVDETVCVVLGDEFEHALGVHVGGVLHGFYRGGLCCECHGGVVPSFVHVQ